MGTSTDGILAYGYDLGEEYEALLTLGIETDADDDDPYGTIEAALSDMGVVWVQHCSDGCPMLIVASVVHSARRGYSKKIESLDEPKTDALMAFGRKYDLGEPRWLLASWWG